MSGPMSKNFRAVSTEVMDVLKNYGAQEEDDLEDDLEVIAKALEHVGEEFNSYELRSTLGVKDSFRELGEEEINQRLLELEDKNFLDYLSDPELDGLKESDYLLHRDYRWKKTEKYREY